MENLINKPISKTFYNVKPSASFFNNFQSDNLPVKTNERIKKKKNSNKKYTKNHFNKEKFLSDNQDIKIIPGIIEKTDLLLNNNKSLIDIKKIISNKVRMMKENVNFKTDKEFNPKLLQELLVENKRKIMSKNNEITQQQFYIQQIKNKNCEEIERDSSSNKNEGTQNEAENNYENVNLNNNENLNVISEKIVIEKKFLESPKLRNTTPLIDDENELKKIFSKSHRDLKLLNKKPFGDQKYKTSDNFFLKKNTKINNKLFEASDNFTNLNEIIKIKQNNNICKERSLSINKYRRYLNLSVNNSNQVSLDFKVKNFNPESQIKFNNDFFRQIHNLYPLNRKKDYFIVPSKKLKADKFKVKTIGNFGIFPNRENKNSIFHKMRNSENMGINRKNLSLNQKENNSNKLSFNFMDTEIVDFYDFESEMINKKANFRKHSCCIEKYSDVNYNNDQNEKINPIRTKSKSISENLSHSISDNLNYNPKSNLKNKIQNEYYKQSDKGSNRSKVMNSDLTCISNGIKYKYHVDEKVNNKENSNENDKEFETNVLSNTFSDPNEKFIKSKNIKNNQNIYITNGEEYKSNDKNLILSNRKNNVEENKEKVKFQSLNMNFNITNNSYYNSNEIKSKNSKKDLSSIRNKKYQDSHNDFAELNYDINSQSIDINNENFMFEKNCYQKINQNSTNNFNDNVTSRNSNNNFNKSKTRHLDAEIYENNYFGRTFNNIRINEINNPLVIKKYEIKNLEKGKNILKLSNGKLSYLPFQKSLCVEKLHFNFSKKFNE